jgi:hypothetical protein
MRLAQINKEGNKTHLKTEQTIEVDSEDSEGNLSSGYEPRNSFFQKALDLGSLRDIRKQVCILCCRVNRDLWVLYSLGYYSTGRPNSVTPQTNKRIPVSSRVYHTMKYDCNHSSKNVGIPL